MVTTTVADYHERARAKAVIDYGFRMFGHSVIVAPTGEIAAEVTPAND